MIKQQPVYVCDYCQEEMGTPVVVTEDVPHEGCSEITLGDKRFEVGRQHYCSVACLCSHIQDTLTGVVAPKCVNKQVKALPRKRARIQTK